MAFVSPGTRFEAREANAIERPSAETAGQSLESFASVPSGATETRRTPEADVQAKTSVVPFVSLGTRFAASDAKATTLPSDETAGWSLAPAAGLPFTAETSVVVSDDRSRSQICIGRVTPRMFPTLVVPTGPRTCPDANATIDPSYETASEPYCRAAGPGAVEPVAALTASTCPVARVST